MHQTILEYLTMPNAHLEILAQWPSTYTPHEAWAPIEEIRDWDDFNYAILTKRHHDLLEDKIGRSDSVRASEEAGRNIIVNETGLTILLGATNISTVSRALPGSLFLAPGKSVVAKGKPEKKYGGHQRPAK